MITRNLLRRERRTLLTVAGVATGVAAIVALGAMAESFVQRYGAISGGSGADLLVTQAEAIDVAFSTVDEAVGPVLTNLHGVQEVSKMVYAFAATEGKPYFVVFGYEPDGFAIDHFKIVAGEGLAEGTAGHVGKPLLLGRAAADDLDKAAGIGVSVLLNASPVMAGLVQARFSLGLFTQALITALVLGTVGGVYPSWWASNLRPVEALRYE